MISTLEVILLLVRRFVSPRLYKISSSATEKKRTFEEGHLTASGMHA
jgi:hypothetical protein